MSWHRRYVEIFFKAWGLINCVVYAWNLSLLLNWLNFFTTSTGWPLVNFRYFVISLYPPRFKLGFVSLLMVTENMTYITSCFTSFGFLSLGQLPSHCNYANYVIHNCCTICPLSGARYQGLNHGFMTSVCKTCWGLGYEVGVMHLQITRQINQQNPIHFSRSRDVHRACQLLWVFRIDKRPGTVNCTWSHRVWNFL